MKIGVFIGDIYQKYETIAIKAMEKYALAHGITLYVFGSFATPGENVLHAEGEKSILYLPSLEELDGLVAMGDTMGQFGMEQELRKRLKKEAACPIVSLRAKEKEWHNVLIDNEKAMYEMTRHFIEEHHFKDICFVTGIMSMADAKERLAGYQRAMEEAGITVTEEMVYYGDYWRRQGAKIVDFFADRKEGLPSAIICSNDYMAISVCDELKKRNIRIPEGVCVSGFDNLDEGIIYEPPLTGVEVPFEKMAERALKTAVALAKGENVEQYQYLFTQNHYRQSCGCENCKDTHLMDEYKKENEKFRYLAKECIYMSTDFESALNEQECLKWAGNYIQGFEVEKCFICLYAQEKELGDDVWEEAERSVSLRYYMNEEGKSIYPDIPFSEKLLLPEEYLPLLDKKTNIFIPLHCKNEVYGYFIFQMQEGKDRYIDERFEFLCMNMGNALKKVYMYYELFSVKDIMQLYLKDPLTNIYNRRGFERKLSEIYKCAGKNNQKVAMVSIDMDGLKYINDTFGHAKGDESLICFSRCLTSVLDKGEFCARMGGDEFQAVLILDEPARAQRFERQLAERIRQENSHVKEDYAIDASVGICPVEKEASIMEYIHIADQRMYENKRMKKSKQRCEEKNIR